MINMKDFFQTLLFGVVCIAVGSCCLIFSRKVQEQAILGYSRFPERYLGEFAERVKRPGYLLEVKIAGVVFILMGLLVIAESFPVNQKTNKMPNVVTHTSKR